MTAPVVVALIDGPLVDDHPCLRRRVALAEGPAHPAARQHATAMAAAFSQADADIAIVNLQIFGPRLTTSAAILTRALREAAPERPDIVHCSFGLERKDAEMSAAVARLQDGGAVVIAAAPARGAVTYPAALADVIAVQGDARCAPNDWSHLDLPTARFGAHARSRLTPGIRGASVAAAHLTGLLASRLQRGLDGGAALAELQLHARFQGRERRRE